MAQLRRYHPVDSTVVPRVCGMRTFMRLPHVKTTEDVDFAVVGIPCDVGSTFRTGSRFGPAAIREMSMLLRAGNAHLGVNIFEHVSGVDYGDINVNPCSIEDAHRAIEEGLQPIVDAGVIPVCLGGDHSITLPELRAVAKKYGPVALVHFDAHLDTSDVQHGSRLTHGTPFARAVEEGLIDATRSIQLGIRGIFSIESIKKSEDLGFEVITARQMRKMGLGAVAKRVKERVGDLPAFLTFDVDFLDPAYAPGTGTIEVGGFTSYEALDLLGELWEMHFVGCDVVEVLPALDPTQITAYVAGNIAHQFISMLALRRKGERGET